MSEKEERTSIIGVIKDGVKYKLDGLPLYEHQLPSKPLAFANKTKYGSPWKLLDNAPMERFFRSLKSEWVPSMGYSSFNEAQA